MTIGLCGKIDKMAQNIFTNVLPGKFRIRWLGWFLGNTAVLWFLMVAPRIWVLHSRLSLKNYGAFLILASILSFVPTASGYLGFVALFWLSMVGNLSGLIVMLIFLFWGGGWEDIASLFSLIAFSLFGLIGGILWELLLWLRRRSQRRSGQ